MRTIKLTISYDGTNYVGWQRQPNGTSVQELIENALHKMTGKKIVVNSASRTDAGVHAFAQIAHFKTSSRIPLRGFKSGINSLLPDDIAVTDAEDAPDGFHSRKDAKGKRYRYVIISNARRSPLLKNRAYLVPENLNVALMKRAAGCFIGTHDYSAFRASGCASKSGVRKISSIVIKNSRTFSDLHCGGGRAIEIVFEGTGFLRHMIRNIVGTLVDAGRGKIAEKDIKAIINSRNRKNAGVCAPASGLYLDRVF